MASEGNQTFLKKRLKNSNKNNMLVRLLSVRGMKPSMKQNRKYKDHEKYR